VSSRAEAGRELGEEVVDGESRGRAAKIASSHLRMTTSISIILYLVSTIHTLSEMLNKLLHF
jgi:hypothetical protein